VRGITQEVGETLWAGLSCTTELSQDSFPKSPKHLNTKDNGVL
jgi:hypothetical protein